ncbi:SMI1/KNR4 family protein [Deinococcus sp.]|uniref:SMI1/KNR4 family protein n=1 Tax=Deinococcus sp. TaxID=47478 RepID=UPI0025E6CAB0|nr:SMI1/KNR4 family protein [Deinococcus sp.]
MDIDIFWQRVDQMLAQRDDLAPIFNPGATEEELQALETELGYPLPTDLRESLAIHNGLCRWVPNVPQLSSVSNISSNLAYGSGQLENMPLEDISFDPEIKPSKWSRFWIPFAEDGSGNLACIDLDPTEAGTVGQVIDFDYHGELHHQSNSYLDWIDEHFVSALREAFDLDYIE